MSEEGVEPSHLAAYAPEAHVSASSTTRPHNYSRDVTICWSFANTSSGVPDTSTRSYIGHKGVYSGILPYPSYARSKNCTPFVSHLSPVASNVLRRPISTERSKKSIFVGNTSSTAGALICRTVSIPTPCVHPWYESDEHTFLSLTTHAPLASAGFTTDHKSCALAAAYKYTSVSGCIVSWNFVAWTSVLIASAISVHHGSLSRKTSCHGEDCCNRSTIFFVWVVLPVQTTHSQTRYMGVKNNLQK